VSPGDRSARPRHTPPQRPAPVPPGWPPRHAIREPEPAFAAGATCLTGPTARCRDGAHRPHATGPERPPPLPRAARLARAFPRGRGPAATGIAPRDAALDRPPIRAQRPQLPMLPSRRGAAYMPPAAARAIVAARSGCGKIPLPAPILSNLLPQARARSPLRLFPVASAGVDTPGPPVYLCAASHARRGRGTAMETTMEPQPSHCMGNRRFRAGDQAAGR